MSVNRWRLWVLAALICCAGPAMAARLAGGAPSGDVEQTWVISKINLHERTIVINDTELYLAPAVTVHMGNSAKRSSLQDLRPGMRVGYRLRSAEGGRSEIYEIWVSP